VGGCAFKINTTLSPGLPYHPPLAALVAAPLVDAADIKAGEGGNRAVVVEAFRPTYDQPVGLWVAGGSGALGAQLQASFFAGDNAGDGPAVGEPAGAIAPLLQKGWGPDAFLRAADDLSPGPSGRPIVRGWVTNLAVYRVDETWAGAMTVEIVVLSPDGSERCRRDLSVRGRLQAAATTSTVVQPLATALAREVLADPVIATALDALDRGAGA
jgi:hypothetical protein